ncbi:MAG: GEVED domain-containing protein [Planctomycetota bacterium]|nr:GEVED domain-containing protein [Planctomycetota bacterium]
MFDQLTRMVHSGRIVRTLLLSLILIATTATEAGGPDGRSPECSNTPDGRRTVWTHLAALDGSERKNAVLDIELGAGAIAPDKANAARIAALWNNGSCDEAIEILRALEAGGLPVAVGVSWKEPVPLGAGGRGMDVRVGAPNVWAKQVSLEGAYDTYAAVVWDHPGEWGWSMNMSQDNGANWVETYHKYTTDAVLDLDTGGGTIWFVYVAYVWAGDPAVPKKSRFRLDDGTIDTEYGNGGVEDVYDAAPATVKEIGIDMTEGFFEWSTFVFALQSDGQLRFFDAFGEEWTGVTNASGGLDTASGGMLLMWGNVASYIGMDGGVYVLRLPGDPVYLAQFTGDHEHTSIDAYASGEIRYYICAVEHEYPNGQGIKHWLSVDDGESWSPAALVYPGSGEGEYMMPSVAVSGDGYAAIYQQQTGDFDQVFFTNKPDLELGEWWRDPVPINDYAVDTGTPLEIRRLIKTPGEELYAYGILYITQHPEYWFTWPLYDRSPGPGGYCHAWGYPYPAPYISNVSVGSIDHSSEMSYGGYGEHTEYSTEMEIGTEYELTVTATDTVEADECGVWIDWNRDLDSGDSYETISVSGTPGEGPYTAVIVPPGSATLGETRMRIRIARGVAPEPCGQGGEGEVEDYTIVVSAGYCAASGGCGQYISRVELAGMDNESGCDEYTNYGPIVGDLRTAAAYPMTITIGNGYDGNLGGLWIDWNRDYLFDGADETIALSPNWGPGPYKATVIPPLDAALGETRMRVRVHREVEWADPCGDEPYGEVEDYVLNIVEPVYCTAFSECDEYISRVQVGDIDNASDCPLGWFGCPDFTYLSTEVAMGTETPITITINAGEGGDRGGLWIDWNQDQDLDDAEETITLDGTPGPGPYTATITPPTDPPAELGATRMRVRVVRDHEPELCGEQDAGEVEDYTIIVVEGQECPADFDDNGVVDTADLLYLLGCWGIGCGDMDGDGDTDTVDLLALLGAWGECP